MLILQKLDKFVKTHDTFDDNSKSLNSNQLSIVFPDTLIYCPGCHIGEMSGYALCEEKPISQV